MEPMRFITVSSNGGEIVITGTSGQRISVGHNERIVVDRERIVVDRGQGRAFRHHNSNLWDVLAKETDVQISKFAQRLRHRHFAQLL